MNHFLASGEDADLFELLEFSLLSIGGKTEQHV
jgi:hypothetical protein